MDPFTLAALAVGGLVLTRGRRRRSRGSSAPQAGVPTLPGYVPWRSEDMGFEERVMVLTEIRNMAYFIYERYGIMPFLAEYLTVIGFIESRFNPWAANPQIKTDPYNAARGVFGMRPKTAFKDSNRLTHLRDWPDTLYNIRWSFVAAVDDIARAASRVAAKGSGVADWLSIRRWWRKPILVHDFGEEDDESPGVRERLEAGLHKCNEEFGTDIDPDFIWAPVQAEGYPGIDYLLYDFGLDPNNPYAAAA